ncbi:hypothetical protein LMG23992_04881 [Cupriavidus laharis]|uniref:Phage coat protein n=1 Tax=Cupriavidus laharis TaxID=151654 RepID=A0ABM8XRR1_9BURK|nr:hypothetical protein [Cupriavidus laharis]CAG9183006.1 hypothetical protein LMG23992_04881 [Cupriavidus laharis]
MKSQIMKKVAVGAAIAGVSGLAAAQDTGVDYSSITAAVAVGGVSAAIVAMGAVKIVPNVTKWATNKLVSFFR